MRQQSGQPMTQDQKKASAMRAPHRRDISARQDLLGKELRTLFDEYTNEDMPDELMKLALQLQGAFEKTPADAPSAAPPENAVSGSPANARAQVSEDRSE